MTLGEKTLNKEVWTNFSKEWAVYTPPLRPSKGELGIYEDYLQKIIHKCKGKCQTLLLGATPELRDLLAKYKVNVTLVDINPNMVKAMTEILEISDGKEKVVIANWLDIPLRKNQFDVILCDHGIHHLYFDDWDKFFKGITRLLKKDGHIINAYVTMEKNEIMGPDKMLAAYQNGELHHLYKWYYFYNLLSYVKDEQGYKYLKRAIGVNKAIKREVGKSKLSNEDYKKLLMPGAITDQTVTMAPKEAVDEMIGKYFTIKSIGVNHEHPALNCHKIYFAKVKK